MCMSLLPNTKTSLAKTMGKGNLRVRVSVVVPTELSDEQEQLLRQLAEVSGHEVASPDKGIFSRIKSAFT